MSNNNKVVILAALMCLGAVEASAQQNTFDNQNAAEDAIENLEDRIKDDAERDANTFGNTGRTLGWSGSVAGRMSASAGNSDTLDVGVGARLGYFDGVNGHQMNLSYSLSEDDNKRTKDELLAGYDYTREIGANTFAYGKLVGTYDKYDSYQSDVFAGVGLGYRVFNSAETQWSLQAGPGYRVAKYEDGRTAIDAVAASVSSDFYQKISDQVFITNDTDVLWAEENTSVLNELGLNVRMTEGTVMRASLLTEHDTDPLPGFKSTDNTLGLSVVYNFN